MKFSVFLSLLILGISAGSVMADTVTVIHDPPPGTFQEISKMRIAWAQTALEVDLYSDFFKDLYRGDPDHVNEADFGALFIYTDGSVVPGFAADDPGTPGNDWEYVLVFGEHNYLPKGRLVDHGYVRLYPSSAIDGDALAEGDWYVGRGMTFLHTAVTYEGFPGAIRYGSEESNRIQQPVPEPGTVVMLIAGLLVMAILGKRQPTSSE